MANGLPLGDGTRLEFLEKDYKTYFNKVTLLYGETGFGKSKLIMEGCYLLKDIIPVWFIISPTNNQNRIYTDKVDSIYIKTCVTIKFLEALYDRQQQASEVYAQANNMQTLRKLFARCGDKDREKIAKEMQRCAAKRRHAINKNKNLEISVRKSYIESVNADETKYLTEIYKSVIRENRHGILADMTLDEEERTSLMFLDFNPNVGVIMDDCGSEAKTWAAPKVEVTKKMFYQNRHNHATTFMGFQDDKDMPPNLRKNAPVNMFTTAECATAYFETKTNSQSLAMRKKAALCVSACFAQDTPTPHYRKLVYLKGAPVPLKYTIADEYGDFKLGGDATWELAKKLPRKKGNSAARRNKFLKQYITG